MSDTAPGDIETLIREGGLDFPEGLEVQSVEPEFYFDSTDDLGVRVWALLKERLPDGVLPFEDSVALQRSLTRLAVRCGIEGVSEVIMVLPEETDMLPSRRREAAA